MKYKLLNQTNPEYDEIEIKKTQLLYEGGKSIIDNANLFILKENIESQTAYDNRLKCASYKNYLSEIVNSYTSEVFNKTLTVMPANDADNKSTPGENIDTADPFYQEFSNDADLKGNSLVCIIEDALSDAMVVGRSYLLVDFPKTDQQPSSLYEEETIGASRAYILPIPTLSVIDWEQDDTSGEYTFIKIKSEYTKVVLPDGNGPFKTIRFKIWTKENETVSYKIYEKQYKQKQNGGYENPKKDDEFQVVDEGTVSFPEIPIVCMVCPSKLCVGNLIGSTCIDHFKRYSSLVYAENRNLFSIPIYKQGPELSDNGDLSEIAQNPNRGAQAAAQMRIKGFAVIGPDDDISFAEPEGKVYELVDTQLKELVDEIHKVTHLMATSISATGNAKNLSGTAKLLDNHSKEIVLTAYGEFVKTFIIKLYDLIAKARNEDIVWSCLGLDDYKLTMDRDQLLKEATSIQLISIPSKTFKKAMLSQIASQFLEALTPQEQLVIKDEISQGVDGMEDEEMYAKQAIDREPDEDGNMPGKPVKVSKSTQAQPEEDKVDPFIMETYETHEPMFEQSVYDKLHTNKLGKLLEWDVWQVDGLLVRNTIYLDFVEGGNGSRYKFVPENELWVEKVTAPEELAPIILHEATECLAMIDGKTYDEAHDEANAREMVCRQSIANGLVRKTSPLEVVKYFMVAEPEEKDKDE